jgi:hypothetical protein
LLQEIKDIKDELNIMSSVFHNQKKVLKVMEAITQDYKEKGISGEGEQSTNSISLDTVEYNIGEVDSLDKFADLAYNAVGPRLLFISILNPLNCLAQPTSRPQTEAGQFTGS